MGTGVQEVHGPTVIWVGAVWDIIAYALGYSGMCLEGHVSKRVVMV